MAIGAMDRQSDGPRSFATFGGFLPMSETHNVELSERQREILLKGLRYVRSSRMLEFRESPDTEADARKTELNEIRQLVEMLDIKAPRRSEPAAV